MVQCGRNKLDSLNSHSPVMLSNCHVHLNLTLETIKRNRGLDFMAIRNPNATEAVDFTHSDARIQELLERMHEITDLSALEALAEWDQNTAMPDGAGEIRGTQMATLHGLVHERWIDA